MTSLFFDSIRHNQSDPHSFHWPSPRLCAVPNQSVHDKLLTNHESTVVLCPRICDPSSVRYLIDRNVSSDGIRYAQAERGDQDEYCILRFMQRHSSINVSLFSSPCVRQHQAGDLEFQFIWPTTKPSTCREYVIPCCASAFNETPVKKKSYPGEKQAKKFRGELVCLTNRLITTRN